MADEKVIRTERCPECGVEGDGAGDNLAVYDDGHRHCFACAHHVNGDGTVPTAKEPAVAEAKDFTAVEGHLQPLNGRGLREETCKKYQYLVGRYQGRGCQIANYIKDGKVVGQKLRFQGKDFLCQGSMRGGPLFGQHLFPHGGKYLTITEGEIDALSMSQMFENRWPVVSVPNGSAGAVEAFKTNLEFINSYDFVKICFDDDTAGQDAALKCAALLRPGKAQIVTLPCKDANACLKAGEVKAALGAWWAATTYRPDGIIHVSDVSISKDLAFSCITPYPWLSMTKSLYGRKSPELVMHASGSGMGKSTFIRKLIHFDLQNGETVGVMMLEESVQDTMQHLMGEILNKPVRQILAARALNQKLTEGGHQAVDFGVTDDLSDEEFSNARETLMAKGSLYLLDHFGSLDSESLIDKMDYMRTGLGCTKIYIDHISIIVSGMESGNERKDIDLLMTNLRKFCQRSDCHVDAVCHLIKPKGTPFEEGGQISLRDFRGSGALYQLSDVCLAYERNQQHPDPLIANTVVVRTLKDRFTGNAGVVAVMRYAKETGDLCEIDWTTDDDGNMIFEPGTKDETSYELTEGFDEDLFDTESVTK